jgi:alpha-galactosidase
MPGGDPVIERAVHGCPRANRLQEEINMGTAITVGVIGAGSAVFSLGLVKDLCLTESLAGSHVAFMDPDEERLKRIQKLATRYARELGADLSFESTADRRVAMQDADVIVNTAAVVGHHEQIRLREVASKHGYYYGRLRLGSFHNLTLMLAVARDMEEICPDAWLIQSGNPVSAGCTLMTRETSIKVCGLCHGHYGYRNIAEMLGLNPDRITYQAPGLNHNIWLTHFLYEGRDAYPLIDEWIRTKGEAYWQDTAKARPVPEERSGWRSGELRRAWEYDMARGAVEQYRMYGLFPVGDTTRRDVVAWWMHSDLATKKHYWGEPWGGPDTELSWPLYVENHEKRMTWMAELTNDPQASLVEAFGTTKTREGQVDIMDALINNNEAQFQVNIPNRGILEGLPEDVVVEIRAVIDQKGIQPLKPVGSLPPKLMLECILPEWLEMERELLAFKTGDRSMLLWQVLENHQTQSFEQALVVMEELLSQDSNREMDEHYKWPSNW